MLWSRFKPVPLRGPAAVEVLESGVNADWIPGSWEECARRPFKTRPNGLGPDTSCENEKKAPGFFMKDC